MKHAKILLMLAGFWMLALALAPAAQAVTQTAGGVSCNNNNNAAFPGTQLFYCGTSSQNQLAVYNALGKLGKDAIQKLTTAQTLFYLFHDYNAYQQFCQASQNGGLGYLACDGSAISLGIAGQTFGQQNPIYSVIYEYVVHASNTEVRNSNLAATANHEAGHQLDIFYGAVTSSAFAGGSTAFLNALYYDWKHLNSLSPPCGFGGVFTGQVDHSNVSICNGGLLNPAYSGTNEQILQQAWPYFFTQQQSPGEYSELWAEEVAVDTGYGQAGHQDHYLAGVMSTLAGNGVGGFSGDGLPASLAELNLPSGVAVDSAGNVFISDSQNNRVRRVDHATLVITTVAGSGEQGFCGDGGPAISACLFAPSGIAVDAHGNLFIADTQNSIIRKVDPSGTITTIAGNLSRSYCGDGQLATLACLAYPAGIAVDASGNLYIADTSNNRIREVFASNQLIATVAGTGTAGFGGDGGQATSAELFGPRAVALDGFGNYFIADSLNARVREVSGGYIKTVAGSSKSGYCGDGGPAHSACLSLPNGISVDQQGEIFFSDSTYSVVRLVYNGYINTFAGKAGEGMFCGDGGPLTKACLSSPAEVAATPSGNDVYIADTSNNRVRLAVPNPFRCTISVVHLLRTKGRLPLAQEYPAGCH